VRNLASISTQVAFDVLWFRNGAIQRKSKTPTHSANDWSKVRNLD